MNKRLIYLSGGITNISREKACKWRNEVKSAVKALDLPYVFFDPMNVTDMAYDNESQCRLMNEELSVLENSTIVVVNLNFPNSMSLGTMAELAVAYRNGISIYAIYDGDVELLHPWQRNMVTWIFKSPEDVADYIAQRECE